MHKIARFHKVSEERFVIDWCKATGANASEAQAVYQNICLPQRATAGSAGYDFFAPERFSLVPNESISIPTGIRAEIAEGWVLQIYPRSGLGFQYRLQQHNTVGIIDSDYFYADNEGHIFVKMINASKEGKVLHVTAGSGFAQGLFLPFGITTDDDAKGERHGGFRSTTKE